MYLLLFSSLFAAKDHKGDIPLQGEKNTVKEQTPQVKSPKKQATHPTSYKRAKGTPTNDTSKLREPKERKSSKKRT